MRIQGKEKNPNNAKKPFISALKKQALQPLNNNLQYYTANSKN